MSSGFNKGKTGGLYVALSNGRFMPLDTIINEYERFIAEKEGTENLGQEMPVATTKLEVGKWFCINQGVIEKNKDKIYKQCLTQGKAGIALWTKFEEANEYAHNLPGQYTNMIETFIFPLNWKYKTENGMRDICRIMGDDMCDEVICYLELQMRICNGESMYDLMLRTDRLPFVRIIKTREGGTGFFGGGTLSYCKNRAPSELYMTIYSGSSQFGIGYAPYMYRKVYRE